MNMGKLKNLSLFQTTFVTWAMSTQGDRMANSYSISQRTWKLFFHLLDLHWIAVSFCHPVVTEWTTERFLWFWFKICWKWVQGSLILNSLQEEDETHQPIKGYDTSNIGQLQDDICSVTCVQPVTNVQLPNFSAQHVKLAYACTHASEFTTVSYISEWVHYTVGKKLLQKCKCCTFHYSNILFYFRNL
jgi:hypothetical protein